MYVFSRRHTRADLLEQAGEVSSFSRTRECILVRLLLTYAETC